MWHNEYERFTNWPIRTRRTSLPRMTVRILRAGVLYWAIVFALGFVLGTIRVLAIAPALGSETKAVILELPVMLLASWAAARWVVRRFEPMGRAGWLGAGGFAFALLIAAEAALAALAFGQSAGEWAESLFVVPGIIGLAGQVAFALMPALAGGARA